METKKEIPSYKEGLKGLRDQLKEMMPAEVLSTFDNDADALQNTHKSILKLQKGDVAPDFTLSNAYGQTVSLSSLLNDGKVVLTFYRGTWCPYCNLQLSQYQQVLTDINKLGANLVAISPQTPDESLSIKEKNELAFEVLSDNGNTIARQFTTVFKNGDIPVNTMKDLGINFDTFYSDDSREIPVPAVFVIDTNHTILFAKAEGGDYRNRVEAAEIIEVLSN